MKKILLACLALGFIGTAVLFTSLISQIVESQVLSSVWLSFEPEENFELTGSRYFVDEAKQVKYYENVPLFLKETGKSENSLGMRVSWDRRGYHFADLIPEKTNTYKGRLVKAGLWVWGGNYLHEIGLIFKRNDGYSYNVPLGNLAFYGWQRKESFLPQVISSRSSYADSFDKFEFSNIRLYSHPNERVNNIYVFLDNFEIDESISFYSYDGYDIEDAIQKEKATENTEKTESN